MEMKIMSLDGEAAGSVDLPDAIFGLEPRPDILHRCVNWQLAKRQAGTHDVKNRAEINRTGKKMYRQKGTGSARHGPARVNLFRGGGRSFGPTPRSHASVCRRRCGCSRSSMPCRPRPRTAASSCSTKRA